MNSVPPDPSREGEYHVVIDDPGTAFGPRYILFSGSRAVALQAAREERYSIGLPAEDDDNDSVYVVAAR